MRGMIARARVIVGDGIAHLAAAAEMAAYDVIIVDSTDPVGVGEALFTEAFYRDCARALGTGRDCGEPVRGAIHAGRTSCVRPAYGGPRVSPM